jgi:hypothetical protein
MVEPRSAPAPVVTTHERTGLAANFMIQCYIDVRSTLVYTVKSDGCCETSGCTDENAQSACVANTQTRIRERREIDPTRKNRDKHFFVPIADALDAVFPRSEFGSSDAGIMHQGLSLSLCLWGTPVCCMSLCCKKDPNIDLCGKVAVRDQQWRMA